MLTNKKNFSILEALSYGFFAFAFVLAIEFARFYFTRCTSNFPCDNFGGRGIPIGIVFICATASFILVKFFLRKFVRSELKAWTLILLITSITAILLQTAYIISTDYLRFEPTLSRYTDLEKMSDLLGLKLMLELFLILIPITILFANRWTIIEKVKNNTALK